MINVREIMIASSLLALLALPAKAQKWEHLADTPQMGWSTWNKFQGEYQDAIQYARWGVDYLKYDWCNTTNVNPQDAYQL